MLKHRHRLASDLPESSCSKGSSEDTSKSSMPENEASGTDFAADKDAIRRRTEDCLLHRHHTRPGLTTRQRIYILRIHTEPRFCVNIVDPRHCGSGNSEL